MSELNISLKRKSAFCYIRGEGGFKLRKRKYGSGRCVSSSYKTEKLYRHVLRTGNFVNFLRSVQFSKFL